MHATQTAPLLDQQAFKALSDLAYRESGLHLGADKTSMVQSRLRHRLKALRISDFREYASFVCSDKGASERQHMISALTTNVSHFFREYHHFETLAEQVLPLFSGLLKHDGRLRIWSAGCSNGQEAYSIAMTVLEHFKGVRDLDVKILATDIDAKVVAFARAGVYPQSLVNGVPEDLLKRYFSCFQTCRATSYQVDDVLKSMISFKNLNLLSDWPMREKMDVIFCRNVVIYFDSSTQNELWTRFHRLLSPDGYLFLGHSERIQNPGTLGFQSVGPTSYSPSVPAM